MKAAVIADLHLSGYIQDKIIEDLPERLYERKLVLNNIIKYCNVNDIKTIIVLGDTLHNKSIIYVDAQNVLLDLIRNNPDIVFIFIDGNHDLSGKGDKVKSALKSIDNEPNVKRIGIEVEFEQIGDCLFIPYSPNMVNHIKTKSSKYLFAHFGLNEATLSSGISIVSNISLRDLVGHYEYVILGHYHKPQEIINEDIKLYYAGSIVQSDWSEKNEDKRFLVIDTETDSIEIVPTEGYRKHIEIQITRETKERVLSEAKKYREQGFEIKLIKTDDVSTDNIEEFRIIDKREKDITNRGLTSNMTTEEKILKFLEIKTIPEDERPYYKDTAIELIESCER